MDFSLACARQFNSSMGSHISSIELNRNYENYDSFSMRESLGVNGTINPLTPTVKTWVIQSFLTFDSMDRTL